MFVKTNNYKIKFYPFRIHQLTIRFRWGYALYRTRPCKGEGCTENVKNSTSPTAQHGKWNGKVIKTEIHSLCSRCPIPRMRTVIIFRLHGYVTFAGCSPASRRAVLCMGTKECAPPNVSNVYLKVFWATVTEAVENDAIKTRPNGDGL